MFICTLDHETTITALHGNGEYIYRVAIGYDDVTSYVYSVMVIFAPLAAYGDGTGYELVFRVVCASIDGTDTVDYHDGAATKAFMAEPQDRADVVDLIMHLVGIHIDEIKPRAVEMMTHTANLPAPALRKFHNIAAVFRQKGYEAGPADPWHGRWIWMMRRP